MLQLRQDHGRPTSQSSVGKELDSSRIRPGRVPELQGALKARDEGGPGTGLEVVCDGCEEKLLGDEQVWVGADECDYCAACQANGGCGEGVWKTAR